LSPADSEFPDLQIFFIFENAVYWAQEQYRRRRK